MRTLSKIDRLTLHRERLKLQCIEQAHSMLRPVMFKPSAAHTIEVMKMARIIYRDVTGEEW